jgi:hypothetical protein
VSAMLWAAPGARKPVWRAGLDLPRITVTFPPNHSNALKQVFQLPASPKSLKHLNFSDFCVHRTEYLKSH